MRYISSRSQRGMALFVSLIFLLLLTIVGLAGMQNATLQEKMAGNVKHKNESFQFAESGLRVGEAYIANPANEATLSACTACAGAACMPNRSNLTEGSGACDVWRPAGAGVYQIKRLGETAAAMNVLPGESVTLFRVVAVASKGNATTVLESIYARNWN